MEETRERFSERLGYSALDKPIVIRDGAPTEIRTAIIHFALDAGLRPESIRSLILHTLGVPPEPDLWSSESNIIKESQRHLDRAEWFEVYDVAEEIYRHFLRRAPQRSEKFAEQLNRVFLRQGVGWKIDDGIVESRGSEAFETQLAAAKEALHAVGLQVARTEVHESLRDLSRRPEPDLTGALQHAAAALECVAREASGRRTATLGQILQSDRHLFPPPLGDALEKLWGFASERARHVREGGTLAREEAELVVGIAAGAVTYLCRKLTS